MVYTLGNEIKLSVTVQCYRIFSPLLTSYTIENHTLENVNQQQYLGVMLDRTMSFLKHINKIISKASKVLKFVKRNLSSSLQSTKETAYFSLVQPTVEYAWKPTQPLYITSIENIQRAAHWVLNDYSRYGIVTTMLQQLHWSTLDTTCKKARLSVLYKAKNNFIALRIPQYYITHHNETKLHHQSSFTYRHIRISAYMNSFYPKTIKE